MTSKLSELTQLQLKNWFNRLGDDVGKKEWDELMRYINAELFLIEAHWKATLHSREERNKGGRINMLLSGFSLGIGCTIIFLKLL